MPTSSENFATPALGTGFNSEPEGASASATISRHNSSNSTATPHQHMVAFPWIHSLLLNAFALQASGLRLEPRWTRPRLIDGYEPLQAAGEPSGVEVVSCRVNHGDKNSASDQLPISMPMPMDTNDESAAAEDGLSSSSFPSALLFLVPEENPIAWTAANNTLTISGCILILDMVLAKGDPCEFSLIWEFATCSSWFLETTLSATYQIYHLKEPNLRWYTKLEVIVAAYFTATTFWMLKQWDVMNQPILDQDIGEVVLDWSFYLYLTVRRCFRATTTDGTTQPPQLQLDEESLLLADTSYQIMSTNDTVGVYV